MKRASCELFLVTLLAISSVPAAAQTADPATIERLNQAALAQQNAQAYILLGQAYFETGQYAEAVASFLEAISLDYLAGDAHFGLGLAEYARGDFESALFSFSEVARLYPERFDGHYNRAVTLVRLRQPDEAVVSFQEAIAQAEPEATPEDLVNAYLGLALQQKRLEDFAGAAEAYSEALAINPNDLEIIYLRAEALFSAGEGLEALPSLTELEVITNDFRVSSLIADIYVQQGQIDYAQRALERALRRAGTSGDGVAQAQILVTLGLLQRGLGREGQAAASFIEATRLNPGSWQAFYNLGISYLENAQTRSALSALQSALVLNNANGEIHLALATAYDQLNLPDEARRAAEVSLDLLTDETLLLEAVFVIGRSLYRLGEFLGAQQALTEIADAQPENAQAQLWAGLAEYGLENFQAAAQFYERAVQLDPTSVEARVNLGAAYLAAQRYEDAELVYELFIEQNSRDADAFFNLGWALFSQNRRDEAREAWERALALGYPPAQEPLNEFF